MKQTSRFTAVLQPARRLVKWTLLSIPVALLTGGMVAFFLWSLDVVTTVRWQHSWLLWLLPVAGIGIHFLYKLAGRNAERGNNLVIDEIHQPGGGVPGRMAPLVLLATLVTHLFGGSAGREGTAVQIGGGLAGTVARWFRLAPADVSILLMTGIAAGFGAVFGTPVAGAVFALEVLTVGRLRYQALIPCLFAAQLANMVVAGIGITHTQYRIAGAVGGGMFPFFKPTQVLAAVVAGVAFGLAARMFVFASHAIKQAANSRIKKGTWLIPATGGLLVALITTITGAYDYIGLGVTSALPGGVSIVSAFHAGAASPLSWLWKLLLTALTLGTGFKGGEVTPLFFIGATLGSVLAVAFGMPVDLFAGLGFIAVFAGAANTPIACTLMGVELFGGAYIMPYAVACFTAYYFSGQTGIYSAQRRAVSKRGAISSEN